jgi:DNA-binding response OmpR family regulator
VPRKSPKPPLILIASASAKERRTVGAILGQAGLTALAVEDAKDAAKRVAANDASGVLVIDAGLLDALHDSQWRVLREHHPGLGVVVRVLIPRDGGSQRVDDRTYHVHPADHEGMQQAVRALAAARRG